MRQAVQAATAAVAAVFLAGGATAQDRELDVALSYSARDEVPADNKEGRIDNDILRLTTGLTWSTTGGRMRAGLELGAMNDDFTDYPGVFGGELVFARRVGSQRYAIGARLRYSEELSTTGELAYSLQHFSSNIDWHGLVGLQFVSDSSKVYGRTGTSGFAQGTAGYYLSPDWVISAGVFGDPDGVELGLGTEYHPGGGSFSFFLDYAEAVDNYRDIASYDNLTVGIRYIPGGETLKSFRRSSLVRVMHRIVEVQ